jgi:hypothetical protein
MVVITGRTFVATTDSVANRFVGDWPPGDLVKLTSGEGNGRTAFQLQTINLPESGEPSSAGISS